MCSISPYNVSINSGLVLQPLWGVVLARKASGSWFPAVEKKHP